jgi:hypothetical protein
MLWLDVLKNWENGIVLKYPNELCDKFQWNTSVLKDNGNVEYKQSFKANKALAITQNYKDFKYHIANSKNKYVTSFPNLSNDTMLVVPMPVAGKNYATLKDFIDNATKLQQQFFWKKVAKVAKNFMNLNEKVWISVHGLGVDYTHVRIASIPKYYFNKNLMKE